MAAAERSWDLFVSHASEDKAPFVRGLVAELVDRGVSVWYDEFSILPGDSISGSIDHGIRSSKAGLVVVSPNFLAKKWTDLELRSLIMAEVNQGIRLIPILLDIGHEQLARRSALLADKAAIQATGLNASAIAKLVLGALRAQAGIEAPHAVPSIAGTWTGRHGKVWLTQESKLVAGEFEQPGQGGSGILSGCVIGRRVVFEYFWPGHNVEGIGFWSHHDDVLDGRWWSRSSLNKSLDWLIEDPFRLDDFPSAEYYAWKLTRVKT